MSALLQIIGKFATPPPPPSRDFHGLEYKWKMFTFRPSEFKTEAYMLLILGAYIGWFLIGRYLNTARAKSALKPYSDLFEKQFHANRGLISSGPSLHLLYSTGRRNILCQHTTLTLYPIHDLVSLGIHLGKAIIEPTYDASESLIFDFTIGRGDAGLQGDGFGVWALVAKNAMRETREKRWDLTFPRLHESAPVPLSHALYTEHSDITDTLLKTSNVGIIDVLSNPKAVDVLKYLLITDQPARRPSKGPLAAKFRSREIVLAFYKPSSLEQVEIVKAWVQVALNIADLMAKPGVVKPEVARKLAKNRSETEADLTSSYLKEKAEDAPPEESAEEKRLAKKKAERAKMSEKEIKRLDELEKKREMRKMAKRQAASGGSM